MKFLKFYIVSLLLTIIFFSCKKDSDSIANNPAIQGNWVGTYGFGNETPHVYYRFNIQPGGVIEELNASGNSKGSGTWSLNGTSFSASYKWKSPMNTVFSVVGTFNAATGKISGTWGYDNDAVNGGLWEQAKQ